MINERAVATKAFQQSSLYALWQNCSASVYWTYSMVQPIISPVSHWSSRQVAWRPCFMLLEVLAQLTRWSVSSWSGRVSHFAHHCVLAWASCPLPLPGGVAESVTSPTTVGWHEQAVLYHFCFQHLFYQWVSCSLSLRWKYYWHCIFKRSGKETGYCWSSLIYMLKWELCSVHMFLAHS